MALVVLFSSTGLNLNMHYCYATGTVEKSLLPFPITCSHDGVSCVLNEAVAESSCCVIPVYENPNENLQLKHTKCCEDVFQYVQIISEFELSSIFHTIVFSQVLTVLIKLFDEVFPILTDETAQLVFYHFDLPIPSGKDVIIALSQLKIARPLL